MKAGVGLARRACTQVVCKLFQSQTSASSLHVFRLAQAEVPALPTRSLCVLTSRGDSVETSLASQLAVGIRASSSRRHAHLDSTAGIDTVTAMMRLSGTGVEAGGEQSRPAGPMALYQQQIQEGACRPDPRQEETMRMLQSLYEDLYKAYHKQRKSGLTIVGTASVEKPRTWWSGLLGSSSGDAAEAPPKAPRGVYMFGGVGCGKTMMMDLLAHSAPPEFRTRRTHFHDFMLDVHSRLRNVQKSEDPLVKVADSIASETFLLCLDEFFVTDVADAMILARLFGRLWAKGVVLVATSNRHPDDLYKNGLQRSLFLPFIAELKEACHVHDLASPVDYRRLAKSQRGTYFIGPSASAELAQRLDELLIGGVRRDVRVEVQMGRQITVPEVLGCVAKFPFRALCEEAVGAADYIALCGAFHTIAVDGLPVITNANRSPAYRFVTFIDVAYEQRCRVLVAAEAKVADVFKNVYGHAEARQALRDGGVTEEELVVDDNLGFTKDRTVSRLIEMQTDEYLEQHAQQRAPQLLMALHERPKSGA
uniref:Lactation elevated protein 1-like n=1 Tax=Tetraselmis sp. GSL018 TaxID=582737 RepID=A0A061RPQ1_9CHLO